MRKAKEKQDNKVEYGTVSLPLPLIEKIKERIKGTGIASVSSYVVFVLRQVLSSNDKGDFLNKEQAEEVKRRLKSLGY
jgi:Arc/MetJ-type ribon-helix-helix transcriptional regulator